MAEFTPNFNLKKPYETDFFNIEDFNGNMDILDEKLKEASQNEQLQGDVTEIKGTTEEIKTSVGSSGDLSTSPTLFGRLAEIKETLTSKFSEVVSKITGVDEKIGTSGDSGTDTVFGKIKDIRENQNKYIIASDNVQIQAIKETPIIMNKSSGTNGGQIVGDDIYLFKTTEKIKGTFKVKGKIKFKKTGSTGAITTTYVRLGSDIVSNQDSPSYAIVKLPPPTGTVTSDVFISTGQIETEIKNIGIEQEFEIILTPIYGEALLYFQPYLKTNPNTNAQITISELNICYDEVTE